MTQVTISVGQSVGTCQMNPDLHTTQGHGAAVSDVGDRRAVLREAGDVGVRGSRGSQRPKVWSVMQLQLWKTFT